MTIATPEASPGTVIDGTADEIPATDTGGAGGPPATPGPAVATAAPDPEPGSGMAVALATPGAGAFISAREPAEILAKAKEIAAPLADLIEQAGLAKNLGGSKKHVEVGGWQACGTMLGALGGQPLHAETVWARKVLGDDGRPERTQYTATVTRYPKGRGDGKPVNVTTYDVDGYSWEACVEVRTPAGVVVGRAEAMCSRTEATWSQRDEYALRSMAETRAESRAYRRAIGWIVHLAGYSPTPAEEMGHTPGADGAPAPATGPAFGEKVSDPDKAALKVALRGLALPNPGIDVDDDRKRLGALAAALLEHGGGYIPRVVAHSILEVAHTREAVERAQRPAATPAAAAPPAGEPSAPAAAGEPQAIPGSVPRPDTAGFTAVAASRALRTAGCICENPLADAATDLHEGCPIQGHGLPF